MPYRMQNVRARASRVFHPGSSAIIALALLVLYAAMALYLSFGVAGSARWASIAALTVLTLSLWLVFTPRLSVTVDPPRGRLSFRYGWVLPKKIDCELGEFRGFELEEDTSEAGMKRPVLRLSEDRLIHFTTGWSSGHDEADWKRIAQYIEARGAP